MRMSEHPLLSLNHPAERARPDYLRNRQRCWGVRPAQTTRARPSRMRSGGRGTLGRAHKYGFRGRPGGEGKGGGFRVPTWTFGSWLATSTAALHALRGDMPYESVVGF